MNIQNLQYFIAIVQNDNNLSKAAEKLHISQPALSQIVTRFERDEDILLFERASGRLNKLTPAGESLYMSALSIVENYNTVLKEFRELNFHSKGSITIGIPPLILTVLFTDVLSQLIIENPSISFKIVEEGSFELRRMLLLDELDMAIMITPHDLNPLRFAETEIYTNELTAFMHIDHRLANDPNFDWHDLKDEKLVIFDDTFMIHHHLMTKFNSLRMRPRFSAMSKSWDFLISATRATDFITILPSPITDHFLMNEIKEVKFKDPIEWHVVVLYEKKEQHTSLQQYVVKSIVDYFLESKPVTKFK